MHEGNQRMSHKLEALIFDLDGVIADTAELHYRSWKRLADEEGMTFTRIDNEALRGITRQESLKRFLRGRQIDESTTQDWLRRKNDYFHENFQGLTPDACLPGVARLLDDARHYAIKCGVASASRNARPVLEKLGMLGDFAVIGDGNTVARSKPAPDIFLWVAERLGVDPSCTIVFEDSEAGVAAALTGEFHVVGIGSAGVDRAHLAVPDLSDVTLNSLMTWFSLDGGQVSRSG